jgi:hypothetical protein
MTPVPILFAATLAIALSACAQAGERPSAAGDAGHGHGCPPVEVFAPGVISLDGSWQWRLSFTPSRQQVYWSHSEGWWPGTRERATIRTSRRLPGGRWSTPQVVPFSGTHADMDPFVTPLGTMLLFSSMRPVDGVERTDMDLWMVRRTWHGWSAPQHLGREVNADGYDELYPSMDLLGNLYFARVKAPVPTEDVDIWRSARRRDGSYGAPERLGPGVNTPQRWEFNPEISPDGRTLLFVRLDRPDDGLDDQGYGWGDLYVSRRHRGAFAPGVNLGPCVNTAADEFHPTMLWERDELFFARDAGAPSDFHRIRIRLPR